MVACQREIENTHDPFTVKVTKNGNIVRNLPKKISSICLLFLRKGGMFLDKITTQTNGIPGIWNTLPCDFSRRAGAVGQGEKVTFFY